MANAPMSAPLIHRLATRADLPELEVLMGAAIRGLQAASSNGLPLTSRWERPKGRDEVYRTLMHG